MRHPQDGGEAAVKRINKEPVNEYGVGFRDVLLSVKEPDESLLYSSHPHGVS